MPVSNKSKQVVALMLLLGWPALAAADIDTRPRLPGTAVQAARSEPGEYWLQVQASVRPMGPLAVLAIFPEHQRVVHRDTKGMHRLLVGPFGRYRSATFARDYLRRQGIDDAFVRFVPDVH